MILTLICERGHIRSVHKMRKTLRDANLNHRHREIRERKSAKWETYRERIERKKKIPRE